MWSLSLVNQLVHNRVMLYLPLSAAAAAKCLCVQSGNGVPELKIASDQLYKDEFGGLSFEESDCRTF